MSEEKQEAIVAQTAEETSEISSADESSDEEIILDEPSDTEDFVPPQEAEDSDASCSSGEEETDVRVESNQYGGLSFSKLVFADIEAKKKPEESDSSEDEDKENEPKSDDVAGDEAVKKTGSPFKKYRTKVILDDAMDGDYKSDEDDNFNPVYCGETLSDIEYGDGDERDTESEPETEEIGTHKKTGEALLSIKMIEELKIPSSEQECSAKEEPLAVKLDSSMECS